MAYDLKPAVDRATRLFRGRGAGNRAGLFRSSHFAESIRREFDLRDAPKDGWAERVLAGLPFVEKAGRGLWRRVRELPEPLWVYRSKRTGLLLIVGQVRRLQDGEVLVQLDFASDRRSALVVALEELESDYERVTRDPVSQK